MARVRDGEGWRGCASEPPPCAGPTPFTVGLTVTSCLGCLGRTGFLGALVGADGLG